MFKLKCTVQNYDWGKKGSESLVAQLQLKGQKVDIDESLPYAEYWFGTHPSGPSRIDVNGNEDLLQNWLVSHPEHLGAPLYTNQSALPFLLKVLSIAKALSVQAHPDKRLAEQLFATRPDVYKDSNHKPEMACALTPFEAMCSFRCRSEILTFLKSVPELQEIVGSVQSGRLLRSTDSNFSQVLRESYTYMMNQSDEVIKQCTTRLSARLSAKFSDSDGFNESNAAEVVSLRLSRQFPGDIGIFSPFLLNVVRLQPGEAIFLGANEPHAYLSGDCVEVMACSDNVVRAGLTPKYKDVDTLTSMLTYSTGSPFIMSGELIDKYTKQYNTSVPEFFLQYTNLSADCAPYALPTPKTVSIIIVISGSADVAVSKKDTNEAGLPQSASVNNDNVNSTSSNEKGDKFQRLKLSSGDVMLLSCLYRVEVVSVTEDLKLFLSAANPLFSDNM